MIHLSKDEKKPVHRRIAVVGHVRRRRQSRDRTLHNTYQYPSSDVTATCGCCNRTSEVWSECERAFKAVRCRSSQKTVQWARPRARRCLPVLGAARATSVPLTPAAAAPPLPVLGAARTTSVPLGPVAAAPPLSLLGAARATSAPLDPAAAAPPLLVLGAALATSVPLCLGAGLAPGPKPRPPHDQWWGRGPWRPRQSREDEVRRALCLRAGLAPGPKPRPPTASGGGGGPGAHASLAMVKWVGFSDGGRTRCVGGVAGRVGRPAMLWVGCQGEMAGP